MPAFLTDAVEAVFPAYAGVILNVRRNRAGSKSVPRIRGGDPQLKDRKKEGAKCSPHTRG